MESFWLPDITVNQTGDNRFETELSVRPDSGWFDGHFPGKPIFPALGLVSLILQVARKALQNPGLRLSAIPRSRIRGLVLPGQQIKITCDISEQEAEPRASFLVNFKISNQGKRVGDGKMEIS